MDIRNLVKSRKMRSFLINIASILPDKPFLRLYYFAMNGHTIDFKNPKGYSEKLQWIKIHDKDKYKEHSILVDKLKVKKVIEEKLGPGHTFPLLGYWESFDEIDFDKLPNEFVLKCNHDSGSTKIIKDKTKLDKKELLSLRKFYDKRLKSNIYKGGREYPYKGIKPYIMAEKLMTDTSKFEGICDYKFFCFDGEPKLMYIATDRASDCTYDFYDMDFNHLDVTSNHKNSNKDIEKPVGFENMKTFAKILSQGIRQVRMDFYEINGQIYFGEYTFFHGGGFVRFQPEEWEYKIGDYIKLD